MNKLICIVVNVAVIIKPQHNEGKMLICGLSLVFQKFFLYPNNNFKINDNGYSLFCFSAPLGETQRLALPGEDGFKSHVVPGENEISGKLCFVWGSHHNSTPPITVFNQTTIASTIITQPGLLLTMKTLVASSPCSSLLRRRRNTNQTL